MQKVLATALLSLGACAAQAAPALHAGGGVGLSAYHVELDDEFGNVEIDGLSARSLSAFLGLSLNPHVSVEIGYMDLGENELNLGAGEGTLDTDGWALSVLGHAPLARSLSAFARVGLYDWESEAEDDFGTTREDGRDLLVGLGFETSFNRAFLRGEWTRYFIRPDDLDLDTDNVSLSLGLRF